MVKIVTENMDPNVFVTNDLLIEIAGSKFIRRIWIDFKYVKNDPYDNTAREGGTNATLIEALMQALSKNIRVSQCLPVVEFHNEQYKKDGRIETYVYRLVDGHNRISALKQLGYTGYFFDVAEFGCDGISYETSKTDFAMACNVDLPKVPSSERDYITQAVNLVVKNEIPNDLDSVKKWLRKYINDGARVTTIAMKVLKQAGSDDAFMEWPKDLIREELPNIESLDGLGPYMNEGNYDSVRNMFGWTTKEGYEHEYYASAISKLYETRNQGGIPSYFIAHTKSPTKYKSLYDRRDGIDKKYENWPEKQAYAEKWTKKHGKPPYMLIGYLPQIKSERSINKIIPVKKNKTLLDD